MKKLLGCLILILFIMVGCSPSAQNLTDITIKKTDLKGFEQKILETLNDQYFAVDIEINNKEVKGIRTTVEYFEEGQFIETTILDEFYFNDKSMKVDEHKLVLARNEFDNKEHWTLANISSTRSGKTTLTREVNKEGDFTSTWGTQVLPIPVKLGEKVIIATYISDRGDIQLPRNIDDEEKLEIVLNHEQVYLVTIEALE